MVSNDNSWLRNFWTWLTHSRKVLLAAVAVIQSVVFNFIPDFPREVWVTINAFLVVLIVTISIEDAGRNIGNGRK